MNVSDASFYRSPANQEALILEATAQSGESVEAGMLLSSDGSSYVIEAGIPDLTYPPVLLEADAFARRIYDSVADVYDEYLPLTFSTFDSDEWVVRNRMVDGLNLQPGQTVLEVGAGTGRTSGVIAARLKGKGHMYVQDISRGILLKAMERLEAEPVGVSYFVGNAVYLPFANDSFDALFHFGGLNMFSDVRRGLSEMARVVRPGGRIVVGDESVPPWLRETEYGKILMTSSEHYKSHLPLEEMPVEARDVKIEYILGGVFYVISFSVGVGEPTADFDFQIPGARGGTHRTRFFGQLDGVTPEAKQLAQRARERRGISMHQWLDEVVREAAERDLAADQNS